MVREVPLVFAFGHAISAEYREAHTAPRSVGVFVFVSSGLGEVSKETIR
jgi:hypothetical protein